MHINRLESNRFQFNRFQYLVFFYDLYCVLRVYNLFCDVVQTSVLYTLRQTKQFSLLTASASMEQLSARRPEILVFNM